ncbi:MULTISPECIES: isoprenylcysteine carboxylmethyltransferase family protein [Paenibacillus]|uniref:Isoprenylcysteine carboxylmethyltransferase family protein n=1 Tax=Paenibacillus tianjinensis TaxID=2810347 RepID=A0ABX7LKG1_9BACL|nr:MULTISPECIES: isoprenylcysteine carboxylmethyltransferase family protein [Paenibacillus]MDF9839659.1 protein-S-isoprenylcysteine O-methyltransferase Ste14 [Paenibacillus sp. PastF-2]MDF9846239.1 protein-S-isoprenylcysteine O-methyltransferase Ste14 [Paenibacillus sp. PastM-2]MDF9852812.1 protein-S-isoprenylcysteine O-methyltransferase Ste14 [Paenibacillus sp. PastF-1]MDH6477459.1 protein-S-isoprenylcysteine O-methyltransferase Ste14 [Paenibacillus sp. PastH-2]QSF47504.1 isoprenylcysteine ca
MQITDIISMVLLIIFGTGYILKLVLLKQREKINANVLAKGTKDFSIYSAEMFVRVSSSLWLLAWVSEIIFHHQISSVIGFLFNNIYTAYIGIMITAVGVGIFILATIVMKSSWRVGIDKTTKTTLVTDGIYNFSRNPAFVGFNLMFIGLFATYANLFTLIVLVINLLAFHLLILQEEKHLFSMFGDEYERYTRKVPRYFLIFYWTVKSSNH